MEVKKDKCMKSFEKHINKYKKFLGLFLFIILIGFSVYYLFDIYPSIVYGDFKNINSLPARFTTLKLVQLKDSVFIYGNKLNKNLQSKNSNTIQIYDILANNTISYSDELVSTLDITDLDVVKYKNDNLVILRKGIHKNSLENTLCYFDLKTKKIERIVKLNSNYDNFFILDNEDVILYAARFADKYSYSRNSLQNIFNDDKPRYSTILGEIPLDNDSFLIITRFANYIYKNDHFFEVQPINFTIEDFSNLTSVGASYPRIVPLSNNRFIIFSYYSKENKIAVYEVINNEIKLIKIFKTKKIAHSFITSQIHQINEDRVVLLGGRYGIFPLITFWSKQNYIYDLTQNRLIRITPFSCAKRGFKSFSHNNRIYVLGGFCDGAMNKDIEVLEINNKEIKNGN